MNVNTVRVLIDARIAPDLDWDSRNVCKVKDGM
jgi:hypothetical protein